MLNRRRIRSITINKEKKPVKNFDRYLFLSVIVIFIFVSVFITLQGVTSGNELTDLEKEASELNSENKKLSEKLVANSSLRDKVYVAEEHGFQKPSEVIYLDGDVSVATLR